MNSSNEDRAARIVAKIKGSSKTVKPYPVPDEETVLVKLMKKNRTLAIKGLLHRKGTQHYVVLSAESLHGEEWVLERWVGIYGHEIGQVKEALMDGFEVSAAMDEIDADSVELPRILGALPRKNGTKQLRLTLEAYDKGRNLKLRAYQKEGDAWKWGDEWFFLLIDDLADIIPALTKAEELLKDATPTE